MRLTDPKAVLGGTTLPGYQPPNVDFKRFQLAGADLLVTAGWPQGDKSGSTVELRVYETFSGQFVFHVKQRPRRQTHVSHETFSAEGKAQAKILG